jgi:uncharacterized membrane protein YdfJ with MMPL/SSD domain
VSNVWTPWDPEGSRFREPSRQEQGPDPEPIVRTVRIGFLFAGMLLAVMVNAALHGVASLGTSPNLAVTATVAAVVLAVLGLAAWAFRPARLLLVGKRALRTPDRRELQPRAERARAMGFRGLAMSWATQAMVLCLLPAVAGLALKLAHGTAWELLAFAGMSLLSGLLFQFQVAGAVRQAVDDPELRARYGPR